MEEIQKKIISTVVKRYDAELRNILLTYTNIKEPFTAHKLRWHGIKLMQQENKYWLEQRGKLIGHSIEITLCVKN